jgi:hypothetical protein
MVLCVLLLMPGMALAQWQWVDASGSKVFSDRPPPSSVPDKNILKRPSVAHAPSSTGTSDALTPSTPQPNKNDLDAKKKKADDDTTAKQQAQQKVDEARVAQARTDNCRRAQASKAQLESGVPTRTTNAKGERVFMEDADRANELQRLQFLIQGNCGPATPPPRN